MPQIKISDASIDRLPKPDKTVWYSDKQVPGFQVAIGPQSRTFYAVGRLSRANKIVRVKVAKLVLLSELAAYLESGRLRIVQSEMGRALIAELQAFEVEFTAAGNMTVDVRRQEHHGDLVIATALALWHAVSRPSGAISVGRLENWY
jgi:hypothetical protein